MVVGLPTPLKMEPTTIFPAVVGRKIEGTEDSYSQNIYLGEKAEKKLNLDPQVLRVAISYPCDAWDRTNEPSL